MIFRKKYHFLFDFVYIEIYNLKLKAQQALQDKYTDKEFHQALIQDGARNFDIIESNIEQYIKDNN